MQLFLCFLFSLISFFALGAPHNSIAPTDTTKGISIQTYGPKGMASLDGSGKLGYIDPTGKTFGYIIFWTRVINETTSPLELTIHFPADSFAIPRQLNAYVKFFLPPETMTLDKEPLLDYGLIGLKSFLDTNFHKPTQLKRTINPKQELLFYTVAISTGYHGVARMEVVLKDQKLYYNTNMLDAPIPCGQIVFKK